MKIKYAFMNGDTTEVEVGDAIGTMILESRKKEESLSRKERYHCYSYDAALYEGNEYGRDAVEDILFPNDRYREIKATLLELEPTQRRRLLLFKKPFGDVRLCQKIAYKQPVFPSKSEKSGMIPTNFNSNGILQKNMRGTMGTYIFWGQWGRTFFVNFSIAKRITMWYNPRKR